MTKRVDRLDSPCESDSNDESCISQLTSVHDDIAGGRTSTVTPPPPYEASHSHAPVNSTIDAVEHDGSHRHPTRIAHRDSTRTSVMSRDRMGEHKSHPIKIEELDDGRVDVRVRAPVAHRKMATRRNRSRSPDKADDTSSRRRSPTRKAIPAVTPATDIVPASVTSAFSVRGKIGCLHFHTEANVSVSKHTDESFILDADKPIKCAVNLATQQLTITDPHTDGVSRRTFGRMFINGVDIDRLRDRTPTTPDPAANKIWTVYPCGQSIEDLNISGAGGGQNKDSSMYLT